MRRAATGIITDEDLTMACGQGCSDAKVNLPGSWPPSTSGTGAASRAGTARYPGGGDDAPGAALAGPAVAGGTAAPGSLTCTATRPTGPGTCAR